jgi:hypothetical protein
VAQATLTWVRRRTLLAQGIHEMPQRLLSPLEMLRTHGFVEWMHVVAFERLHDKRPLCYDGETVEHLFALATSPEVLLCGYALCPKTLR